MNTTMNSKIPLKNSIQTKLMVTMAIMLAVIMLMNLVIYSQINSMLARIDSVFASNVSIGQLTDTLDLIQQSTREYLNTKSSHALEDYYRYTQDYRGLIGQLSNRNTDSRAGNLEKTIRSMSESYLEIADDTVQAKRGRNVERYKNRYEEGARLYRYINDYIYQLNSLRFEQNSENYQMMLSAMRVFETLSLGIILVVFGICLILAIVMIREMIRPLTRLSVAAARVAEGDFDVDLPEATTRDEVGIVTNTFGQMLKSIRAYIQRLRTSMETEARMKERELAMEANLREAQLRFLQAQINPHFLFNSLNAGAQLAMMEDAESTGIFLQRMADFFRYNVKKSDGEATLGEEIALVDDYIYILNVRFAGDITYEKQVDESLLDRRMPGMLLQPLVENAVSHGIRDRMDQGRIRLAAELQDRGVLVTVSDNGRGMSREELGEVLRKIAESKKTEAESVPGDGREEEGSSAGIALTNVARRLRLFYDQDDLLFIHSEGRGEGTEVTVLLPEVKEEAVVQDIDRG